MATANPRTVFISYSHADAHFADSLSAALSGFGLNVWKDDKDIAIGGNILKSIYDGIRTASHFCCIISTSSVRSAWVEEELSFAKVRQLDDRHLQIVPILIDQVEIPDYLKAYLCAHLEGRDLTLKNAEFLRVLKAFGTDLTHYHRELLVGMPRKRLLVRCRTLKRDLFDFHEVLSRFQQAEDALHNAWSASGEERVSIRDGGSASRTSREFARRAAYASKHRIDGAQESAEVVFRGLQETAGTVRQSIDRFRSTWQNVDPTRSVARLHALLWQDLDQVSYMAREISNTEDESRAAWWVQEKLPRWVRTLPQVEASVEAAIALLESWARFDPAPRA